MNLPRDNVDGFDVLGGSAGATTTGFSLSLSNKVSKSSSSSPSNFGSSFLDGGELIEVDVIKVSDLVVRTL